MNYKMASPVHSGTVKKITILFSSVIMIVTLLACQKQQYHKLYVSSGNYASDDNPGTVNKPVFSVHKALSMLKPGDTLVFSQGTYECKKEKSPDGLPGARIVICSKGDGKVLLTGDGSESLLVPGSYTTIKGLEFTMTSDKPEGCGIYLENIDGVDVLDCRFFACNVGVGARNSHHINIHNCEMAFSGTYGIHLHGSGGEAKGHLDPSDMCSWIDVRNCWMHDAGWNIEGTEGYGITSNGAVENLVIENCQIDNNTGDGILYEDWAVHTTARYNVIRGTGIAAIWIDNASMSIFDNNFLYGNNVGIWLSGEESSNRLLTDLVSIRNNIIVHNDWSAIDTSVYGRTIVLFSQNVRDLYFDNNTVAFNKCDRVVGFTKRPPLIHFRNIWFRNNIFWDNSGEVKFDAGLDTTGIHFNNNLWNKPFRLDRNSHTGEPAFADPNSTGPEGYVLKSGSAAINSGILLHENQLDFRNAPRPIYPEAGKFDIGAMESGSSGSAIIGLDLSKFPFKVTPYKLQFKMKPTRE